MLHIHVATFTATFTVVGVRLWQFEGRDISLLVGDESVDLLHLWRVNKGALYTNGFASIQVEHITTTYQLLGVENQTNVHYAMPVRNMLYDAISYTNQVDAIAVRNRKGSKEGLTGAEFLSGFTKEDHLYPVITLVLYWSPDFWDGPHSLHEMLEPGNDDILKFVSDYRLNILSPADIPKSGFKKFTSPISEVFQYIQGSADKEELNRILQENPNFRHLDRESAELINAVTKSDLRFEEGEETIDMCTAIQQMRDESVSFGMKEGRKEGREEGMDDMAVVIQRLYDSGRTGDMQRALTDRDYLDQLIAEFCGKK